MIVHNTAGTYQAFCGDQKIGKIFRGDDLVWKNTTVASQAFGDLNPMVIPSKKTTETTVSGYYNLVWNHFDYSLSNGDTYVYCNYCYDFPSDTYDQPQDITSDVGLPLGLGNLLLSWSSNIMWANNLLQPDGSRINIAIHNVGNGAYMNQSLWNCVYSNGAIRNIFFTSAPTPYHSSFYDQVNVSVKAPVQNLMANDGVWIDISNKNFASHWPNILDDTPLPFGTHYRYCGSFRNGFPSSWGSIDIPAPFKSSSSQYGHPAYTRIDISGCTDERYVGKLADGLSCNFSVRLSPNFVILNGFNLINNCPMFNGYIDYGKDSKITQLNYIIGNCYSYNRPIPLPPKLTNLGGLIWNCPSFNQPVHYPKLTYLHPQTIYNCSNFNSPVTFAEGSTIFRYAYSCSKFNQPITIPSSAQNLSYLVYNCRKHNASVTFDGCTQIDNMYGAFSYTNMYQAPILSAQSVRTNFASCFSYCFNLFTTSMFDINASSTDYMYSGCNNLQYVSSTMNLTSKLSYMFNGCTKLEWFSNRHPAGVIGFGRFFLRNVYVAQNMYRGCLLIYDKFNHLRFTKSMASILGHFNYYSRAIFGANSGVWANTSHFNALFTFINSTTASLNLYISPLGNQATGGLVTQGWNNKYISISNDRDTWQDYSQIELY